MFKHFNDWNNTSTTTTVNTTTDTTEAVFSPKMSEKKNSVQIYMKKKKPRRSHAKNLIFSNFSFFLVFRGMGIWMHSKSRKNKKGNTTLKFLSVRCRFGYPFVIDGP